MVIIDGFAIDATLTETHQRDSAVSMYPVESGAQISDNIQPSPDSVSLECIVSNTPLPAEDGTLALPSDGPNVLPSDAIYAKLMAIRDARKPVQITTALEVMDSMAMESLSIPITMGDCCKFTAVFKRIIVKVNQRTSVPVSVPRGNASKNLGNKTAPAAGSTTAAPAASDADTGDQSLLYSLAH